MKTFQIELSGNFEGDIEMALAEVARLIAEGYTSGFNSNDTGSFSFDSSGEYDEDETEDDAPPERDPDDARDQQQDRQMRIDAGEIDP